jgi:hypothetical protein
MNNTNTNTEKATVQDGFSSMRIISRHATLSEAVTASGMDLSYNPEEAQKYITRLEKSGAGEAFVTEEGVFFNYECDISLLNKFSPFIHCISNSPFHAVFIWENTIQISTFAYPKTRTTRIWAKNAKMRLYSN